MANLFPTKSLDSIDETIANSNNVQFKGSYGFDFEKGEFIKNTDGTIKIVDESEAYFQWCQKAMSTNRYKYSAYSNKFGKDLIGDNIDQKAMELEIIRTTTECLMAHPMTSKVSNFNFEWGNGEVYFTYIVTTIQNQTKSLANIL